MVIVTNTENFSELFRAFDRVENMVYKTLYKTHGNETDTSRKVGQSRNDRKFHLTFRGIDGPEFMIHSVYDLLE